MTLTLDPDPDPDPDRPEEVPQSKCCYWGLFTLENLCAAASKIYWKPIGNPLRDLPEIQWKSGNRCVKNLWKGVMVAVVVGGAAGQRGSGAAEQAGAGMN